MKDKIFGVLQRVGRSFMLPIAVLPVAGLLLGIGSSFTNETTIATYGLQGIFGNGTVLHALLMIMSKAGNVIFDNLPIIFAVGVAIGMAKAEKEVAALSAMISFFVMHASINAVSAVFRPCRWVYLAVFLWDLVWQHSTTGFIRLNCQTHCHFLAAPVLYRLFLPLLMLVSVF